MDRDIELEPRYSTREIPGRCIKCLAEDQYLDCLRALLKGGSGGEELEEVYEALVSFLKSPDLQKLRDESERHLAEERDVKIVLHLGEGEPRYEIKASQ
jgi:hypothetical protein